MAFSFFEDSAEYQRRKGTPFSPPKVTISDIHAAVPKDLYCKSTWKASLYILRDVSFALFLYKAVTIVDTLIYPMARDNDITSVLKAQALRYTFWLLYWWWQGIVLAGWWCLGHEAGHGNLSDYSWFNHFIGYTLHTFLLVPYYSWRSTHHAHHKATGSIERDENYVPRTRTDYGLPDESKAQVLDYHEIFEETPIYTLCRMLAMQLFGWHAYLLYNALGSPSYPEGTSHLLPSSPLFKPHERRGIIASNLGLLAMVAALSSYIYHVGIFMFVKMYFIPYLLANHWIVMLTFLHHTDPTIPHYRGKEWSFLRGALATVDRPLLGWVGRFFLHNVSHDHVAHHIFSTIPFYNQPKVTMHLKRILQDDYNFDSTNSFCALYRSFTECCFIEDDGEIVFYKNKDGKSQRSLRVSLEETTTEERHLRPATPTEELEAV